MEIVVVFAVLVVLAALLSAWAHLAARNALMARAIYVVFGGVSVLSIAAGIGLIVGSESDRDTGILTVAVGSALGLALIPLFRRLLAHLIPIDPRSIPDMVGLAVVLAGAVYFGGSSLVIGDDLTVGSIGTVELVGQAITLVLIGYLSVGFLINRNAGSASRRLGLGGVTIRELGVALVLVFAAFAISIVAAMLTAELQPELEQEIRQRTIDLTSDVSSFSGALTLGISAGVGEEILFRGAIQPRFGLVLTSIVFALVHVQYGFSVTVLGIFAIGLLFGWERKRYNTTAAIITHVVYDIAVVLLSTIDTS